MERVLKSQSLLFLRAFQQERRVYLRGLSKNGVAIPSLPKGISTYIYGQPLFFRPQMSQSLLFLRAFQPFIFYYFISKTCNIGMCIFKPEFREMLGNQQLA